MTHSGFLILDRSHFPDGCTPLALLKTVTKLNMSVIYWDYINHISAIYVPNIFCISPLFIFGADPLPFLTFYTFWAASLKAYFDLKEFGLQSA